MLIVVPLCLAIFVAWAAFERVLYPPRPQPVAPVAKTAPVEPGAQPAASASPSAAPAPAEAAAGAPAANASATAASVAPRVGEDTPRELVLTVGERGQPGNYRAVFTNVGGGLKELRSGRYYDHAGLGVAEKDDWKHWWPLVGNTAEGATQTPTSFALNTLPNSAELGRADVPLERELWSMRVLGSESAPEGVEFTLSPGTGVTFVKRLRFVPHADQLTLEVELRNDVLATASTPKTFNLTPVAWTTANSGDSYYLEPQAAVGTRARAGEDLSVTSLPRDESGGEHAGQGVPLGAHGAVAFVGVHSKYFAVLLSARDDRSTPDVLSQQALVGTQSRTVLDQAFVKEHPERAAHGWRQIVADAQLQLLLPPAGQTSKAVFDVYAGPKVPDELAAVNPDLKALHVHDLTWVRWISTPLLVVLKVYHWLTSSWGIAIILLTFTVRLVLFPINRRSQTAMARYAAKMKRIQPKIDELKKRYANDASKLRQEQAKIMQQEGAFPPLGGCLPMFLQIPVFIGLYRALGISFDLRQASFMGWISDLALPDRLLHLGWHLPLVGTIEYLNILPPIMVALWIWQQRMMPTPTDEQAARMQKMMMFMPLLMGVFLYNYAAGLSLYMITQSGLGILEMKVIRKYWPVDDTEVAPKKDGFLAKMVALQEQAERQKRARREGR